MTFDNVADPRILHLVKGDLVEILSQDHPSQWWVGRLVVGLGSGKGSSGSGGGKDLKRGSGESDGGTGSDGGGIGKARGRGSASYKKAQISYLSSKIRRKGGSDAGFLLYLLRETEKEMAENFSHFMDPTFHEELEEVVTNQR